MLSRKDREAIRLIVQEELRAALCRKIKVQRGPKGTGDFEKTVTEEEWNVLEFMAMYAPKIEAAIRGTQQDVDKVKNKAIKIAERVDAIGSVIIDMERTARMLAGKRTAAELALPADLS